MPVSLGLFTVQAYLSAEAYVAARQSLRPGTSTTEPHAAAVPATPLNFRYAPSVFFETGEASRVDADVSPYRSHSFLRFPQNTLPQGLVDYLLNRSFLTGRYYSLFRHGPASAPNGYEVREGSPTECDRSVFGGGLCDSLEEAFFNVAWVAHVHPPHISPLPSNEDLSAVVERAQVSDHRNARHSVFGFIHHEPVCVEIHALWDPLFEGLSLLHRASPRIAVAADLRIQEWLRLRAG
jgi:hypothetical protein